MAGTSSPHTSSAQWGGLVRGAATILFGIYLTFAPVGSLIILAQLAAAYVLVDGIVRVLVILTRRIEGSRRPNLIIGIVGIITSAIVLVASFFGITLSTGILTLLVIILGTQLIILGGIAFVVGRETGQKRLTFILSSLLPIALGVVLVAVSFLGVSINIVRLIGLIALVYGGYLIWRGLSRQAS